ncbi:MAG: invasin domain 3-containing protein, partial [bacterium]|nr:invasin domain 3-containing protein [bacterium]
DYTKVRARTINGILSSAIRVDFVEPPTQISVLPNNFAIPADGLSTTVINAYLQDQYTNPVSDGIFVNFSTSHGVFVDSGTRTTSGLTSGGVASTTIRSTTVRQPSVTVTAKTDAIAASSVNMAFIPGPPALVNYSSNPPAIAADGLSEALVSAIVRDSGNSPVKDGLLVIFTTDLGTFPNGTQSSNPVNTSGGRAEILLKAGLTSGTPSISARIGGTDYPGTPLEIRSIPTFINISAVPSTIAADGVATSLITANVNSAFGVISSGIRIDFKTTGGTLNPAFTTVTGVNGNASVELISEATSGSGDVKAYWTNGFDTISSQPFTVTFFSGAAASVNLASDSPAAAWDGTDLVNLSAEVFDADGNHAQDNTKVYFDNVSGVNVTFTNISAFTSGGYAFSLFSSNIGSADYTKVRARTINGILSSAIRVDFVEPPAQVTLSANPIKIPADGISTGIITATLQDQYGYPVKDGILVNFLTSHGSFVSTGGATAAALTSGGGGLVTVSILSTTVYTDTVTITASTDAIATPSTTTIAFNPGPPTLIQLSANPSTILANGYSTSTIEAFIQDTGGNAVKDNLPVTFSIISSSYGTFPNGNRVSNPVLTSGGYATVDLTVGTKNGIATLTAQIGSVISAPISLTIDPDNVSPIVLATVPVDKTLDVPNNSDITVQFNEPIDSATLNATNIRVFENSTTTAPLSMITNYDA